MAILSLVLSLTGVVVGITAPVGAVLGHLALRQIGQTGEAGKGLALSGIIIGWIITGVLVLACCIGILAFTVASTSYN